MAGIYYEYNIAVAPHVKKFIEKHFGEGAIPVGKGDPIGRILLNSLKKDPQKSLKSPVEVRLKVYERRLRPSEGLSEGKWLSAKGSSFINEYFTDLYDLKFYTYVAMAIVAEGKKMNEAISAFREFYDITDDHLGFSSMEKSFYRIRTKFQLPSIEMLKKSGQLCPIFNQIYDAVLLRDKNYAIHRHRKIDK